MFFGRRFSGHHKGRLSGLDILVLSIIKNNNGISGYDIIQQIEIKFKGSWKASAGTIYPLLSRLTEKTLIAIQEITENKRQKKIYMITEKGIEELKYILENKLQSSINTIGDYIKTVIKAIPMFSCFPFPDMQEHCMFIPENKEDVNDYKQIKSIVQNFTVVKQRLETKLEEINNKLNHYEKIFEKMRSEAKSIEIVDDDEEFENF
jgi:DNA-binding PadR family transcriptional regulator